MKFHVERHALILFAIIIQPFLMDRIDAQETMVPRSIDNFSLIDHEDNFHELYYYEDMKAIVIVTQGNDCPIIRQNIEYLQRLKEEFEKDQVTFLMLNANVQDTRRSIVQEAQQFNIDIPILKDEAQIIARSLMLTRTAEALVIDPRNWAIVYQGPINDRVGYETQKKEASHHYVRDAVVALLEHRPVQASAVAVKGCLIHFERDRSDEYSYTEDIAPILINKCIVCHSPGQVAPWSMDNYKRVRGWGPMIREVVRINRMPPWHADPVYGDFENNVSLTSQEIRALVRWAESGFERGAGEDPLETTPRPKPVAWKLGEPDLVFNLAEPQEIPATGLVPYRIIPIEKVIENDLWIRAVDLNVGNRRIVHHADVTVSFPENSERPQEERDWYTQTGLPVVGIGQVIAGYSPGSSPLEFPKDTGMFLPKGSKLSFWLHYVTTGKPETDDTSLGLYLHDKKPKNIYSSAQISNKELLIPPGEKSYRTQADYTFTQKVLLTAITPHMHYRGKSMKITIEYPDGRREVALSVPRYKFQWQRRYILQKPKRLPAGTRIIAEGSFDNSAQNPDNPDPTKAVTFGMQSDDEMFSCFLSYIIL